MNAGFGAVTIVGVGLLGGSLGLALKQRGLASCVRGVGRRQEVLDTALSINAIDDASLDLGAAVRGADLIVLCTPAVLIFDQLDTIRSRVAPNVVVTDVGSTKTEICAHVRSNWSRPLRFVGSHPMAGSEKFGPEHASANLYDGCVTIVEPLDDHAEDAHETVCALWRAVGSRVIEVAPRAHDDIVARTSHIPHVVAALIAELAAASGEVRDFTGKGFRDVTRIAAGRAELWRDICLTNRNAIVEGLREFGNRTEAVRELIERGKAYELEAFFRSAQVARKKVLGEDGPA
ncbi:MAG: prephenate dehydrogenase/arogenate dehydrogenase family protein [Candidatus Hydrogenedentes bacterium]|nr:prephenate dehydrogenase/arogenate dehydrogenase family protein [Candidatus Hydrogenedentota bacterium]